MKKFRISNFKTYQLIYVDYQGNELQKGTTECQNIKQARKIANDLFWTTSINDLKKITVRRIY